MRAVLPVLLTLLLCVPALAAEAPVTRGAWVTALWESAGGFPFEDTGAFSDVPHDAPYTQAVCWAHSLGVVQGTGEGRFSPDRPITREEAAILLRRWAGYQGMDTATISNLAECNDYDGISPWADDSLYWATERRYMDWSPGGLRDPYGTVTQAELAETLSRIGGGI